MTSTGGYNPMRWECENRGCWKQKCSPNIEYFAHALPRKIAMTDLDGTVEVNGNFLFLEWKSHSGDIPTGQRIYFERLTKLSPNITAVIVAGNPETMEVERIKTIHSGKVFQWVECDLEGLFQRIEAWAKRHDIQVVETQKVAA